MHCYRLVLFLLLLIVPAGCDSAEVMAPAGPEKVRVDLQTAFDDDLVVLELDGDVVFSGRVTTDYRLSLAETVPLSLPEGEHRLRVVVNREASSSREFVAGNVVVIAVRYDDVENDVALDLLVELPLYD